MKNTRLSKNNPFFGKHHTKKNKKKMSSLKKDIYLGKKNPNYKNGDTLKKYYCKNCKKQISLTSALCGSKLCASCYQKSKILNPERHKIHHCKLCENIISYRAWKDRQKLCKSCAQKERFKNPKNHYNYIDGRGYDPYSREFIKKREQIQNRDNYICQNLDCHVTEKEHLKKYNTKLEIHHINYIKNDIKENNLIVLCKRCNIRANQNRDYWYAYFTYITENR